MKNELEFRVQKNGVERTVTGSEFRACAIMCGIKTTDPFVSFFGHDENENTYLGYVTKWSPYLSKKNEDGDEE